jgi:hypothetical protein
MALKVEEKLQRQLQMEEKRRLVKLRNAQPVQDKKQRRRKQRLGSSLRRKPKKPDKPSVNSRIVSNRLGSQRGNQNNARLATEEVDLEAAGSADAQLAPPADARPRRQKKLPVKL